MGLFCKLGGKGVLALTGVAPFVGIIPQSQGWRVRFPMGAHAYVAGSLVREYYERQPISISCSQGCFSPSFSLLSHLSKYK